ncbi:MAG: hypothetical protein RJA36_1492 [Pseudomonadota bacterium]
MIKPDEEAATEFVELLVGWRPIGVVGDDPVFVPRSRELRAFLAGALGSYMPRDALGMTVEQRAMLGAYLRAVADIVDSPL